METDIDLLQRYRNAAEAEAKLAAEARAQFPSMTDDEMMNEVRKCAISLITSGKDIGPRGGEVLALLTNMLFDLHAAVCAGVTQLNKADDGLANALESLSLICEAVPKRLAEVERRLDALEKI